MIIPIASPDNQFVKLAASLRHKKHRDATGLFAVEGIRLAGEAVASDWELQFALVSEPEGSGKANLDLITRLEEQSCAVYSISEALYKKVGDTQTPQGILLVVRQKPKNLSTISASNISAPWIVLDSLQDPGNVGTIIRTADAAGAAGVILTGDCADVYAGKTARATMGSLFHLPVIKASSAECLAFCERSFLPLYVAGAEADMDYTTADLSSAFAVVLGNEGAGVGPDFRSSAATALCIPIPGQAESLNVAAAAAIIMFEAVRQRQRQMPCNGQS